MHITLYTAVFISGLSGIAAQILLLRELLISYLGNELTLGVILANWLISESLGAFIIGKSSDKVKNPLKTFISLLIIFSFILPVSVYFSRVFKMLLHIPAGEIIGLPLIFISSFLIILAPAFCHGALFSCGCKLAALRSKDPGNSIGSMYSLETAGTIAGGILLTYILLPLSNSFNAVFMVSCVNFALASALARQAGWKQVKYIALLLAIISIFTLFSSTADSIHNISLRRQFKTGQVLGYENSVYGNVLVSKKENQLTFFHDGIAAITVPTPDITFVEELGNIPLLFCQHPENILIISGGAGGIINQALKYPLKSIDYVELNPLTISMLKKFPTDLTDKELSDLRVRLINTDGRFFVQNTKNEYDLVIVGLSGQSTLSTNRLFTQEFFSLIKKRLRPDGILAFYLPGSLTYLSRELKDLNSCVLNAAEIHFAYTRVIPGDYNLYILSASSGIMDITAASLTKKMQDLNIQVNTLVPDYLKYRLDLTRIKWFEESMKGATLKINRDSKPYAVFQTLILWNKQFSRPLTSLLESAGNLKPEPVIFFIIFLSLLLFLVFGNKPSFGKICVAYAIASTGFFSLFLSLIIIFIFQILYGYLYHVIGLLISLFMAGIALGSALIVKYSVKNEKNLTLFIIIEAITALFSFIIAMALPGFSKNAIAPYLILLFFSFISGALVGIEFPIACKLYIGKQTNTGETSGLLSLFDLIGGCIAGILGGVIFLPVLGLFSSCIIILILKLCSFFLLLVYSRQKKNKL